MKTLKLPKQMKTVKKENIYKRHVRYNRKHKVCRDIRAIVKHILTQYRIMYKRHRRHKKCVLNSGSPRPAMVIKKNIELFKKNKLTFITINENNINMSDKKCTMCTIRNILQALGATMLNDQ